MIRPSIISSKNNVVVETSQRAILPCRAIGKPKVIRSEIIGVNTFD